MNKKLLTVLIIRATVCAGKTLSAGKTYELKESDAILLIRLGKAKKVEEKVDVGINGVSFNEMTLAELGEVEYKKLNRDPLVEYARACGLEIADESKKEIYALIEDVDFDQE